MRWRGWEPTALAGMEARELDRNFAECGDLLVAVARGTQGRNDVILQVGDVARDQIRALSGRNDVDIANGGGQQYRLRRSKGLFAAAPDNADRAIDVRKRETA